MWSQHCSPLALESECYYKQVLLSPFFTLVYLMYIAAITFFSSWTESLQVRGDLRIQRRSPLVKVKN